MGYHSYLRGIAKEKLGLKTSEVISQSVMNAYLRRIEGLAAEWGGEPTIRFGWIEKNKQVKLKGNSGLTEKISSVSIINFLNGTDNPHSKTVIVTSELFGAEKESEWTDADMDKGSNTTQRPKKIFVNEVKDDVIKIESSDRLRFLHVLYNAVNTSESEIIWVKQEYLDKKSKETKRAYDSDDEYNVIFELVYLFMAALLGVLTHGKKPKIHFVFYPAQNPKGNKHVAFAHGLGFNVVIKKIGESAPFEGWLFDTDAHNKSEKMIWRNSDEHREAPYAPYKYLVFDHHYHGLIQHFSKEIKRQIPDIIFNSYEPQIVHFKSEEEYLSRLKAVQHYKDEDIEFRIVPNLEKEVGRLNNTIPHQTTIRAHKDLQFPLQRKIYKKFNANFTKPSFIKLRDDVASRGKTVSRISVNNLPIIELNMRSYHVVDGHTRIHHYIYAESLSKSYPLGAVIVENCSDELPNPGLTWDDVRGIIYTSEHETDREDSERDSKARKVEKYTHHENWDSWYPDLFRAYGYE